jgi:type VI secretion system protein ImpC
VNIPDRPFTILALAPFSPLVRSGGAIDVTTVNDALANLAPEMWVPVSKEICPEGGVLLKPERMRDFTPDGMVEAVPYLKSLYETASLIGEASGRGMNPAEIAGLARERLPGLNLDLTYTPANAPRKEPHSAVDDILSMVAAPSGASGETAAKGTGPAAWKAQITAILSGLIEEIFANHDFMAWEAAWRGLEIIAKRGPAGEGKATRLLIATVTHETLSAVLDSLETSLGDDPPNLVLLDLPFDNAPVSVEAMERIASFGGNMLAPVAVWLTPRFFNLSDWDGLKGLPYLKTFIDDAAYAKWRKLAADPSALWLFATCNRFLARSPYGEENKARAVSFTERSMPWVSPVFALGALAALSVSEFGTPASITNGERVRLGDCGLAPLESGGKAATETVITLDRVRQLTEIGVSPLTGAAMQDTAYLPLAKTVSGDSLPFQIFFSCITGFLIRLKEMTGAPAGGDDVPAHVREALALFFGSLGYGPPHDLDVDAAAPVNEGIIPLDISFTPPRDMLPGAGRISFRFMW